MECKHEWLPLHTAVSDRSQLVLTVYCKYCLTWKRLDPDWTNIDTDTSTREAEREPRDESSPYIG